MVITESAGDLALILGGVGLGRVFFLRLQRFYEALKVSVHYDGYVVKAFIILKLRGITRVWENLSLWFTL